MLNNAVKEDLLTNVVSSFNTRDIQALEGKSRQFSNSRGRKRAGER